MPHNQFYKLTDHIN